MPTSPRIHLPYPNEDSSPWNEVFKAMVEAIDQSLYASREDRNIVIAGGGFLSFDAASGILTWADDIDLLASFTGYRWRIQGPGQITLLDGQLAYLTISRAPQSLASYALQVGGLTPNEPRGDDQLLFAFRRGDRVHFRDGYVLNDGDSSPLFDTNILGVYVKDEGTTLGGGPHLAVDFVGEGVDSVDAGSGVATVSIPGTIPIQDEGTPIGATPHRTLNFIGSTIAAGDGGGGVAEITVTPKLLPVELVFLAGLDNHDDDITAPKRVGARYLDLSPYAATIDSLARTVTFRASIEVTNVLSTGHVRLRNKTDDEVVTGTDLTTSSDVSVEVSAAVTVGAGAGELKDAKHYAVEIYLENNDPGDRVTCSNARLEITYA